MTTTYDERSVRTRQLLGTEAQELLRHSSVMVLGLGGVGGHAAECLARSGIGRLILIDGDQIEVSNCNRQLAALTSTIGRSKAEVIAERCRDINPDGDFIVISRFIREEEVADMLDRTPFSAAVDAIDDVPAKVCFLAECLRRNIPIVSSMGAGGKVDPGAVRIADIGKTFGCPLARVVRGRLRAAGITKGIPAVFSPETALPREPGVPVGTVSYLPAVFGCFCASVIIRKLAGLTLAAQR